MTEEHIIHMTHSEYLEWQRLKEIHKGSDDFHKMFRWLEEIELAVSAKQFDIPSIKFLDKKDLLWLANVCREAKQRLYENLPQLQVEQRK